MKSDKDQQYLNVKPNEGYGEFKFYDGVYKGILLIILIIIGNWK